MIAAFWILSLAACYSYLLYPVLLWVLPARRPGTPDEDAALPMITLIIAARNEEGRIGAKLEDALEQDYPPGLLQIFVVSDSSTDGTDDMVREFADRGVHLLRLETREGKESAQALGISKARSDLLVFSDVATRMGPGSLRAIAGAFRSPEVGAVSSEDRFEGEGGSGEGAYVRYEMALRRLESDHAGLVGLSGSFFAIRRVVASEWRTDVPSDFVAALNSVRLGMKAVSVPAVQGIYPDLAQGGDEFARKRRTAIRGMAALAAIPEVLNPSKFGFFALQVFSHKVMRWCVPWFLLLLFGVSIVLAAEYWLAGLALALQLVLYLAAGLGWLSSRLRRWRPVRLAYYFVQVNAALALALIDLLRGHRVVVWEPSKR